MKAIIDYITEYEKEHKHVDGTTALISYTSWLINKIDPIGLGRHFNYDGKAKTIIFKSTPKYWNKEALKLKRNTVRKIDTDERFEALEKWRKQKYDLTIGILNTETKKIFYQKITDVTKFDNYFIISW